jgi:hypothetical protein
LKKLTRRRDMLIPDVRFLHGFLNAPSSAAVYLCADGGLTHNARAMDVTVEKKRPPLLIAAVILVLALLPPAVRLAILYLHPAGTVPTGLGIPDSALFFQSMDMFFNGFETEYATALAGAEDAGIRFYAVPHLWLYGLIGVPARLAGMTPLIADGIACALCAAFFLAMMYRLFRAAAPDHADRAFLLFALSAGPGGLLYLLTGALGLHQHPDFAAYFFRFAVYDLMEGPHLNPALYYPRCYYTLSLGLCAGALAALIRAAAQKKLRPLLWWIPLLALGSFINARYGVFTLGLALLFLYTRGSAALPFSLRSFPAMALGVFTGGLPAGLLMHTNETVVANHLEAASMAMWLSPFIAAALFHLIIAAPAAIRDAARMPLHYRLPVFALIGYLAAFCAGYLLYQGYWGNLLTGRDGSVAAAVSDPALIGAVIGLAGGCFAPLAVKDKTGGKTVPPWILLWFLIFFAVSISGWLGGWFLRFGPQRMQVLIWPALCLLTAIALSRFRPSTARILTGGLCGLGLFSVLVASFIFQGPRAVNGPFRAYQAQVMTDADASLFESVDREMLLAPPPASDVAALRKDAEVVYGIGSFNLTTVPYVELKASVEAFFHPDIPDADRRAFIEKYGIKQIWCPDTWPVSGDTRAALRNAPWLEETAALRCGAVYRVRP